MSGGPGDRPNLPAWPCAGITSFPPHWMLQTGYLFVATHGNKNRTVDNSFISHIPFYFWLESKSATFLRRHSLQSPESWKWNSPDISTAQKMLTWVLRHTCYVHEVWEAHKLANLPFFKKKEWSGDREGCCPPGSLCGVSGMLLGCCTNASKLREDLLLSGTKQTSSTFPVASS